MEIEDKAKSIKPDKENRINYGDLVIIYENGDSVKYFTLEKGKIFNNKYGSFYHDSIYSKQYCSKIYSTQKNHSDKYITVLSFVPNIWERCLDRMTQILFNPDISLTMTLLNITQNSIIYESGTGSGCLSTNMSQILTSNNGHLYTFEFNKERVDKLLTVFKLIKLDQFITVIHRDVIEDGFIINDECLIKNSHKKCDCMFIDLPSPWKAIKHAVNVLKNDAYFVSFSPCIEQINETMKEMKNNNFINIRMFENIYRTYSYAKTISIDMPNPNAKRKFGDDITFEQKEINLSKNKCDIRGHTGFLLFGIYHNDLSISDVKDNK